MTSPATKSAPLISGTAAALMSTALRARPTPQPSSLGPEVGPVNDVPAAAGAPIIEGTAAAQMAARSKILVANPSSPRAAIYSNGTVGVSDATSMCASGAAVIKAEEGHRLADVKSAGMEPVTPTNGTESCHDGFLVIPKQHDSLRVTNRMVATDTGSQRVVSDDSVPSTDQTAAHAGETQLMTRLQSKGMDMLADIICHAPPMAEPGRNRSPGRRKPDSIQGQNASSATLLNIERHVLSAQPHALSRNDAGVYATERYYDSSVAASSDPSSLCQHDCQQGLEAREKHLQRDSHDLATTAQHHLPMQAEIIVQVAPPPSQVRKYPAIPSYQEIYQELKDRQEVGNSTDVQFVPAQSMPMPSDATAVVPSERLQSAPTETLSHHPTNPEARTVSVSSEGSPTQGPEGCVVETVSVVRTAHPRRPPAVQFGHPKCDDFVEGKRRHSREFLRETGAHRLEHKDVHGNQRDGCDSIVISKVDPEQREGDGLCWFLYTCSKINGGGTLCRSYHRKRPIRVFRSSDLGAPYAPSLLESGNDSYRYDGLYSVKAVWDDEGNETEDYPAAADVRNTFFFTRLPKRPLDGTTEPGMHYNALGLQELWGAIQKSRGIRKPRKFQIPQPCMKLPPLSTGSSKAKESKSGPDVISSSSAGSNGKVFAKKKKKKKSAPPKSPVASKKAPNEEADDSDVDSDPDSDGVSSMKAPSDDEAKPELRGDPSSKEETEDSRAVIVDTVQPKAASKHAASSDASDTDSSAFRSKRASAAAARCYLKKAMHNRFGVVEEERPRSPLTESPDRAARKRRRPARYSDQDDDDSVISNELESASAGGGGRKRSQRRKKGKHPDIDQQDSDESDSDDVDGIEEKRERRKVDRDGGAQEEASADNDSGRKRLNDFDSAESGSGRKKRPCAASSADNDLSANDQPSSRKQSSSQAKRKKQRLSREGPETDEDADGRACSPEKQHGDVDPELLSEGSRVLVQYKGSPYKATVRKTRDDSTLRNYLIHYDGNKKSNVHWVSLSAIEKFICDDAKSPKKKKPAARAKSPARTSRTERSSGKSAEKGVEPKSKAASKSRKKVAEKVAPEKFPKGSNVYVEYKDILYSAEVLNTRRKKNVSEYLVHYDGYKKTSNCWVKEDALVEINASSTRSFNEQRSDEHSEGGDSKSSNASKSNASKRKSRSRASNCTADKSEGCLDMGDIMPGVDFLPGSCVFVEWNGALYLAKMIKRRYRGGRSEYLVHYDGYKDSYDSWVSLSNVYEINPQTRRIFSKTEQFQTMDGRKDDQKKKDKKKPDSKKSGARAKQHEPHTARTETTQLEPKHTRAAAAQAESSNARSGKGQSSRIDMGGVLPGVDFLPGSTLFAEYKSGLFIAKMLKRRGKGDDMEYFIHYNGFKRNPTAWVSVSKVYEINPQTKRIFSKQKL